MGIKVHLAQLKAEEKFSAEKRGKCRVSIIARLEAEQESKKGWS